MVTLQEILSKKNDLLSGNVVDFTKSPQALLNAIQSNTSISIPSNAELESQASDIIASLNISLSSLSLDEIQTLSCQFTGNELYFELVQRSLLNKGVITSKYASLKSLEAKISELNKNDDLKSTFEEIWNNVDLKLLKISDPRSSIRYRGFKIGPFLFNLKITLGTDRVPIFVSVTSQKINSLEIIDSLKKLAEQTPGKDALGLSDSHKTILEYFTSSLHKKTEIDERIKNISDTGFSLDDFVCEYPVPIDPSTGKPIFDKSDIQNLINSLCNPPAIKKVDIPELPTDQDQKSLECLNSVQDKIELFFNDNISTSRYIRAEKELEELLFHYDLMEHFYSSLHDNYVNLTKESKAKDLESSRTLLPLILELNSINISLSTEQDAAKKKNLITEKIKMVNLINASLSINLIVDIESGIIESENIETATSFTDLIDSLENSKIKTDLTVFDESRLSALFAKNGKGDRFLKDLVGFSARFKGTKFLKRTDDNKLFDNISFTLDFVFESLGVFKDFSSAFLDSFENAFSFLNSVPEGSNFGKSLEKIETTSDSKESIISYIEKENGKLYSQLLEVSNSPWLFFDASERGDNDARTFSKIKASSYDADGNPNSTFQAFYNDYKKIWDKKYAQEKENKITPIVIKIKESADNIAKEIAKSFFSEGAGKSPQKIGLQISTNQIAFLRYANEFKARKTQIEDILLEIGIKGSNDKIESNFNLFAEGINKIGCISSAVPKDASNDCYADNGAPGASFNLKNPLGDASLFNEKEPHIFSKCYWKEYSKFLNKIGTLPIPTGLPPVRQILF